MSTHICKDCGASYTLTEGEKKWFTRKQVGMPQMSIPVRCKECRKIHSEQVKHLGQAVIKIANAQSGEGCFLGLTRDKVATIASWGSSFPWHKFAPREYPLEPTAVVFNIDQELAGAVCFIDRGEGKGIYIKALEYAPWLPKRYPDAPRALVIYMVNESIRRGYDGKISIGPPPNQRKQYEKFGFKQSEQTPDVYVLQARDAQLLLLQDLNISDEVIRLLDEGTRRGSSIHGWVVQLLVRGRITPEMVAEICKAPSGIKWNRIKRLAENPSLLESDEYAEMINKLRGLLGQLQAKQFLHSIDPNLLSRLEHELMGQSLDLIVRFSQDVTIRRCLTYDTKTKSIRREGLRLKAKQGSAIEVKIWQPSSYTFSRNMNGMVQEIRKAKASINTIIVMVSSDFEKLPEKNQAAIVRTISENGGVLKLIPQYFSGDSYAHVRRFVRSLESNTTS